MAEHQDDKQIFLAALALSHDDRSAFLDGACQDSEQRVRIDALLRRHDEGTIEFLRRQEEGEPPDAAEPEPPFDLDEFKVIRELGRGGMGIVYLAKDTILQREVAVKVLSPGLSRSTRLLAGFQQEAVHVSKLRHAAIVPVYRFGRSDGFHFIVSQYIEGQTLRHLIDEQTRPGLEAGQGDLKDWFRCVASMLATISEALSEAHGVGIVHRDIKPSNIMWTQLNTAHLLDFGIAIRSSGSPSLATPVAAGSVSYMSPEHALIEQSALDGRSDVFSLGVVLYEALTSRLPFSGSDQEAILQAIQSTTPVAPRRRSRGVPRDLEVICLKALEKDPSDRYQSAAQFGAELRCWMRGAPILARRAPISQRAHRYVSRHRTIATAAVAALLAGTGATALAVQLADDRPRVRIANLASGASVYLSAIDVTTGAVSNDRRQVDRDFRVEPGYYRVVVTNSNGQSAEATLYLETDASREVFVNPTRTADVEQDMVRFDPIANPILEDAPATYRRIVPVAPAPFLIDRYEVSNAEYEAYVLASDSNVPAPAMWGGDRCPPELRDLPVVGVTLQEAQGYAAWVGKRLPTAQEWIYAARGPAGRRYPAGEPQSGKPGLNVQFRQARGRETAANTPISDPGALDWYDRSVVPTRGPLPEAARDDRTPEGLLFMYGNVREWTETVFAPTGEPNFAVRATCGHAWDNPLFRAGDLPGLSLQEQPVGDRLIGLGFRCAKSIHP